MLTATVAAMAVAWSFARTDVNPATFVAGLGDSWNLVQRMVPPRFDNFGETFRLVLETFWIAIAGTTLATVLGFPLAFLYARNTTPHLMVRRVVGVIIVGCRAIPDIIFALIFVRALSIGVLPGVLAIGLHSIGMIGKLFTEAIERTDDGPREAVASTGGGRLQQLGAGVLPQVVPAFVATILYRLDINIRGSVILGFVGAGGVGVALRLHFGSLDYQNALGVVIVIAVVVIGCELASAAVRRAVLGADAVRNVAGAGRRMHRGVSAPAFDPRTMRPPRTGERLRLQVFAAASLVAVAVSYWQIDVTPSKLIGAMPKIWSVMTQFFPPDLSTVRSEMIAGMVETVAIALAATSVGALLAIPVGLLAARNVAPYPWVSTAVRALLVFWRALPELTVAIIFVAAVGLGPFPGVMALAVLSFGFVGKLVADAAEEIRPGPREAVLSTGAGRLQEASSSVVPQLMPAIVGSVLYALDVNVRAATILGIVGAGGVGFLLNQSIRGLQYQVTGGILLLIFVSVLIIEQLSAWLRRQLT